MKNFFMTIHDYESTNNSPVLININLIAAIERQEVSGRATIHFSVPALCLGSGGSHLKVTTTESYQQIVNMIEGMF
jgi:hypothetical protein